MFKYLLVHFIIQCVILGFAYYSSFLEIRINYYNQSWKNVKAPHHPSLRIIIITKYCHFLIYHFPMVENKRLEILVEKLHCLIHSQSKNDT